MLCVHALSGQQFCFYQPAPFCSRSAHDATRRSLQCDVCFRRSARLMRPGDHALCAEVREGGGGGGDT